MYGAFHTAVAELYNNNLNLDKESVPEFDDNKFMNVARKIYGNKGFSNDMLESSEARDAISETFKVIDKGISSGVPHDVPKTLLYALENNAFIFSGFKTFHALREIGLSLTNENGMKSWNEFKKDALAINDNYNHNYLKAEYQHAIGASMMAVKWNEFELNGDRYELQYRTAKDSHVREAHRLLDGTTLPKDDPFWNSYFPPNGWGCRCTAIEVRKNKYPESDPQLAMQRGNACTDTAKTKIFRYNPGKTMNLFPPKHPYYKVSPEVKKVIEKISAEEIDKKRIDDIIKELPDNLTDKEKNAVAKNCVDIEKKLKYAKGEPMSVNDADKQSANPNFDKSNGYKINCQTCSPAYALRLRGFNITAKPKPDTQIIAYEEWKNIDGSQAEFTHTQKWMHDKGYKRMSEKRYNEFFKECCNEVGVYEVMLTWKGRGSRHATILQKFDNGELRYVEPQLDNSKGSKREKNDYSRLCSRLSVNPYVYKGYLDDGVMRIDNKILDTSFTDSFNIK